MMFLLDKLITTPLMWIAREINEAVQKEQVDESESITRSLSELYMRLETGEITEAMFEAEETKLLDRLDAIALRDEARTGGE
ncbi:MAG: gas vesicle protein GvpG [Gallionella sp.]